MKSYLNPQPYAVDRVDKIKTNPKPSNLEGSRHKAETDNQVQNKSDKEIFKTEAEEQAWRDVLEKDKSGN